MNAQFPQTPGEDARRLAAFIRAHPRLAVLTGAGLSTASGIPEYRDDTGKWIHRRPMQYADFVRHDHQRRRYWAQSFAGWQRFSRARPNAAHKALARLELAGRVSAIVTQNVDNLHRAAGSRAIIDLHGVLQRIRCLDCGHSDSREAFQDRLGTCNPDWQAPLQDYAPDGDANLGSADFSAFNIPDCGRCGGVIKPDVVFFGEPVPRDRVERAGKAVAAADALLVVGSSLMVFSGYRFARIARDNGKPVAILNRGLTRADHLASLKLTSDCAGLLVQTMSRLAA